MDSESLVDHYLAIVRASPDSTDEEIIRDLIGAGAAPDDAWWVARVTPAAFCQQTMGLRGVTFGTGYVLLDEQSRPLVTGVLGELPLFVIASERARTLSDSVFVWDVAQRSPESRVIELARRDGADLGAIRVDDMTFVDFHAFVDSSLPTNGRRARDVIHCEVCDLRHRSNVAICEDCQHVMGRPPDWLAVRGRRNSRARHAAAGVVVLVGMLALNVWAFDGAGYIIFVLPLVWLFMSAYRYRVLARSIRRHALQSVKTP